VVLKENSSSGFVSFYERKLQNHWVEKEKWLGKQKESNWREEDPEKTVGRGARRRVKGERRNKFYDLMSHRQENDIHPRLSDLKTLSCDKSQSKVGSTFPGVATLEFWPRTAQGDGQTNPVRSVKRRPSKTDSPQQTKLQSIYIGSHVSGS